MKIPLINDDVEFLEDSLGNKFAVKNLRIETDTSSGKVVIKILADVAGDTAAADQYLKGYFSIVEEHLKTLFKDDVLL